MRLRKRHPGLIYLLDREFSQTPSHKSCGWTENVTPAVMGDSGVLYVSPNVVSVYRVMLPLATIITPNWFEAE